MTTEIHKYGSNDGWHGVIKEGGEFPPEKDRYHLYIGKYTASLNPMLLTDMTTPH
jgi:putative glutathione S-transferase